MLLEGPPGVGKTLTAEAGKHFNGKAFRSCKILTYSGIAVQYRRSSDVPST